MARLIWWQADGGRKDFPLGDSNVVGREGTANCRLRGKSVSRRHARIDRRGEDYVLTDLGSRNGTLVNGEAFDGERILAQGDRLQVGEEVLELDLQRSSGQVTRGGMVTEPLSRALERRVEPRTAASGQESALPRRAGKFYLVERLGQGGMGVVYRAIDLDSNREVAVKFIRRDIGRREAFLDFFHNREAVLAREIAHPNVISVYEHGVAADQHYISMEYVSGESLYQRIKRRACEPAEVLETLRQIACGLAAAHRRGVVHSDIKPANILIRGQSSSQGHGEAPSPQEASSARDEDGGILEFEDDTAVETPSGTRTHRYDPELLEEIRKRVGEPVREVILDPPYFPRASETAFLAHYLERSREGRGYVLLVEGDSGTGKDRLISEFLAQQGCATVGRDQPPESALPLFELDCSRIEGLPFLYGEMFGRRPSSTAGSRQLLADILEYLKDHPGVRVVRLLNLGSATPLASDLIAGLAGLMPEQGLLVVASLDPEELRKNLGLRPLLERISMETKELYIRPLTEYQVNRYLQQIFPGSLCIPDLAADAYRLSRGNFAKLLQILKGFFERRILSTDQISGSLQYRPRAQEFELEEGKNQYEHYKSLGKVEQRVLQQAAFIGPRFVFDVLLRLSDINETSLFFIVRTLLAEGILVEEGAGWFAFANGAFQKYLAEGVPLSERRQFHQRVSRLLESALVPESPALHELKARHCLGCKEYAQGVRHLLEGAYLARNDYQIDMLRDFFQEIIRIYRMLSRQQSVRREVVAVLREWFRRDGNWYEILGEFSSEAPRPSVKITDFGISFRLKDEERGYQVEKRPALGTPRYMAPERSKGEYGGYKSDIFSLGVITYELAAGEPPFPDLKGNDVVRANRERLIALPPDVTARFPKGMDALIAGMLAKDPGKRWDAERVTREVSRLQMKAGLSRTRL